ncbi:MAG: signal peptide peptidase SppA [Ignavibacteria bacterium]|nr:signal peptide peptidase SppA [Ignavibacteria bacterium]
MKQRKIIFSLFIFQSLLFSQTHYERAFNSSINDWQFSAGVDGAIGSVSNPATLGIEHGTDLWYTNFLREGNFLEHNFFVQAPFLFTNFGASYRKAYDTNVKNSADLYGFGFGVGSSSFSFGYTADFFVHKSEEATLSNIGFLVRPSRMFSLSYVVKNFNVPSISAFTFARQQILGVGIRPTNTDVVSLFFDAKSTSGNFSKAHLHAGMDVKIFPGIHILASYHDDKNSSFAALPAKLYSVGLRIDFSQASIFASTTTGKNYIPGTSLALHFSNDIQQTIFPQSALLAEITIEGEYDDFDEPGNIFSEGKQGLQTVIAELDKAANDKSIGGVLLNIRPFTTSYAIFGMNGGVQELKNAIERVKANGKPVVVFLSSFASLQELYLASAADNIVMPQYGFLLGYGISYSSLKYKYMLKKFGVDMRTYTAGKFKSALNSMSDTLSPWKVEELNTIADDLYAEMIRQMKEGRKNHVDEKAIDTLSGIMYPQQAKSAKIIDEIGWYEDAKKLLYNMVSSPYQMWENGEVAEINADDIETVSMSERKHWNASWNEMPTIAVIGVYGGITQGESLSPGGIPLPFLSRERSSGSKTVSEQLENAMEDDNVKAIILRVDSPGGDGIASDDIYRTIQKVREKKLVVVSMGSLAASGGYYVSCTGAKIFANPATLTASIGVISQIPYYYELFDTLDIWEKNFSRGTYSNVLNLYESPNPEGEKLLVNALNVFYEGFLQRIMEGRKLKEADVREHAQGRIWTGVKAKEKNLIDEFGGLYDAVQYVKKETELGDECSVKFYRVPSGGLNPFSFVGAMFSDKEKNALWNLFEKRKITVEF